LLNVLINIAIGISPLMFMFGGLVPKWAMVVYPQLVGCILIFWKTRKIQPATSLVY